MVYSSFTDDTFCAPATAPVDSSIAVIRVNGPAALETVRSFFSRPEKIIPREACHGTVLDEGKPVDDVIILYFKSPATYTGDDLVEIHCHGNQFIVHRLIKMLMNRGVRIAEPGEFTRRAFINGKMDLTEAEAVNHIITARSDWEVETSLKQMHGSLRQAVNEIRDRLITLKADIESGIDFIEEDIEFISSSEALDSINKISAAIKDMITRCRTGQKLSRGIDLAIVGKPNVGKSSILNLLLNQERAIVSDIPGTTRDMIKETVQIKGIHLNIIDTAGIGIPSDEIERIGIELTGKKIEEASLVLCVLDATTGITEQDRPVLEKVQSKSVFYLINKIDLTRDAIESIDKNLPREAIPFSARTAEGIGILETEISDFLRNAFVDYRNSFIADVRVITLLEKALGSATEAALVIEKNEPPEIIAFEIQALIDYFSEITGEITPEDVLNSIFSRFCIGK
ncbi:MAG TPA: tRNA uridine-5-carboxymethylaminomethyl(34) synthesis GTPase MnmE [Spirochaetota bacterium]|nr:tRNA uridine-5-carboxymethylaminomethyl(34) synthesis GTPase MnmE [Spirochaetota bacterium]HPI89549.1 tRNA uridine-5-carboxymethylaminomethyl(34) synthesis GTPase MnmE [Spirochaetota bacterium]HPR49013.1 tRNA uridine-5-carboxymethylaminomethyl(34) synthesis GTPase MnmE [Spirochaetota bacterium]